MKTPKVGSFRVGSSDMEIDASPVTFRFNPSEPGDRLGMYEMNVLWMTGIAVTIHRVSE
jgi:hypothetical protein